MWGNERKKYEQKEKTARELRTVLFQTLFVVELIDEFFNDPCIVIDTFRRLFLT